MIMRTVIYAVFLLLLSGVAQAATVTLDFEGNSTTVDNWTYTQGFRLIGSGSGPSSFDFASVRTNPQTGNSSYGVGADGGVCNSAGCNYAGLSLYREDNGVFALYAVDVDYDGPGFSFIGITADNQTVDLSTALGTGGWLNLISVGWDVETPPFYAFASDIGVSVDNIVVSQVPVPAAVWLFASGLAALG
jgi:hypothetical protein